MPIRRNPIIPPEFFITRKAYRHRSDVETHSKLVRRVRSTSRAVLLSDGENSAWVPKRALVATSEPDILGTYGWYKPLFMETSTPVPEDAVSNSA